MIDHLTKLRARNAAQAYMYGVKIRQDANELSPGRLAAKFRVSDHAIARAIHSLPTEALNEEDAALVRDCYAEHRVLARQAERLTLKALSKHYQVAPADIQVELDLAGYVSPHRQGRKEVVA